MQKEARELLELERPITEKIKLRPTCGFFIPSKKMAIVCVGIGFFEGFTLKARLAFLAPPTVEISRRKALESGKRPPHKFVSTKNITSLVLGLMKYTEKWKENEVFLDEDSLKVLEFRNVFSEDPKNQEVLISYSSTQNREFVPFGPIESLEEVKEKLERLFSA